MAGRLAQVMVATALTLGVGCSKESKPVAEDPKVPAPSANEGAADKVATSETVEAAAEPEKPTQAPDTASMKSSVSEDSFDLKLAASGAYKVGEAGQVEVILDAKAPFKVNQEYPYSFTINESAGLSFASMKLKKDAVKLEEKRATLTVPFTPKEAGQRTVSGSFKFSVCTEEQCLIKKSDLALAVTVQ